MATKRQMASLLRQDLEAENRKLQERARIAEAGVAEVTRQRDALLSKTSTRFRDYVQNLEAETGELQERARTAIEGHSVDMKVMHEIIDQERERVRIAEERVMTARKAFDAILHNGMFAEIYAIAKEALEALYEHEHAAQATPDVTGQGEEEVERGN